MLEKRGWTTRMTLPCKTYIRLAILFLLAAPTLFAQRSSAGLPPEVGQLLALTNQNRVAQGLGALRWSPELARAAALHAQQMAVRNSLEHQFGGEADLAARAGRAGAHFHVVAENIAMGPDAITINREWMHSPQHRANILDPRLNAIGIALVRRNGGWWAVQDFAETVESLGSGSAEDRVIGLLGQAGLPGARPTAAARQTCAMDHGSAGPRPQFIMRWEGSDLSRLPDVLLDKLRTRSYRSAAVAVCSGSQAARGFTTYKVAVLLY